MTPDPELVGLSIEEAFDVAIAVEEEARRRYLEFTDQMTLHHTEAAAAFFRRMAEIERGHAERLRKRRIDRFGAEPGTKPASPPLGEVEAPGYEHVRAFMTIHRALDVALESERKAYRFYDEALRQFEDEDLHSLFEDLRDQEMRHQELIEEFRATLPEEDETDPDGYVDEPRAL